MSAPPVSDLNNFLDVRDRLLRIARRIVGSPSDAEDVVQDAWLRWHHTDRTVVRNAQAFLCLATTRLSITATRTAHVRHQSPAVAWLDLPDPADDPSTLAVRTDQLRAATLLLVQRLSPRERVAYVLREAFGYPYREIGDLIGLTEANARQLIGRARTKLAGERGRPGSPVEQLRLLGAFLEAARTGDPAALVDLARDPVTGP